MDDQEEVTPSCKSELSPLTERPNKWRRSDYILLILGSLINFGDGIEIFLPGVITQRVSCELGVDSVQEGILGSVFYMTLSFSTILAGPLSDRFGRREVCLFSLYTSVLVSIFCAIVANFYTLLLSRALVGFTVGFNLVIHCVLISGKVSSKEVLIEMWLVIKIVYSLGGVWVSVLGYLILEKLGWRVFVVLTSLPVFIPPIIILHFYISPEENYTELSKEEGCSEGVAEKEFELEMEDSKVIARTCKSAVFVATGIFQSWSTILLLPSLVKLLNMEQGSKQGCDAITQGTEFLLLAFVAFAEVLGRFGFYLTNQKIRFRPMFVLLASLMTVSYIAMLLVHTLTVAVLTNFLVKFGVGMVMMQFACFNYHADYYGTKWLAVCSSLSKGCGVLAGVAGVAMASFAAPHVTVITAMVLSVVQACVVLTMTEI